MTTGLSRVLALAATAAVISGCTPERADRRAVVETEATTSPAHPCQLHIEIKSAAFWARELDWPEMQVLATHRINLWQRLGDDRGRKVGELLPGSRAAIIEESAGGYRVRSPMDKSIGWVSKVQVERTLHQHVETREPCTP